MKRVDLLPSLYKRGLGTVPEMQFLDCSEHKFNKREMALLPSESELAGRHFQPGEHSSQLRVPSCSTRRRDDTPH
jgi:hypothetical protein